MVQAACDELGESLISPEQLHEGAWINGIVHLRWPQAVKMDPPGFRSDPNSPPGGEDVQGTSAVVLGDDHLGEVEYL
ncbi:hypothetical protein FrEUN1fDRAFT_4305 [Parafrankia sp. EUN1f]|nr:hypothetical protein FrEUN1fDRAFT_4305 [Parafrankia sp. EUN1f]